MNPQEQCLLIRLLYVMLHECPFEGGQVVRALVHEHLANLFEIVVPINVFIILNLHT